jgi:hypothetical protein
MRVDGGGGDGKVYIYMYYDTAQHSTGDYKYYSRPWSAFRLVLRVHLTRLQINVHIAESSPRGGINHFSRQDHPPSTYSRRANSSTWTSSSACVPELSRTMSAYSSLSLIASCASNRARASSRVIESRCMSRCSCISAELLVTSRQRHWPCATRVKRTSKQRRFVQPIGEFSSL